MPDFAIRRGQTEDAKALAAFAERTFRQTFSSVTPAADMDTHCASRYAERLQRKELADPTRVTLLVEAKGESGLTLAGFSQIGPKPPPISIDLPGLMELERFYIDTPFHGMGIAQVLMQTTKDAMTDLHGRALWLSVFSHNTRAIRFYEKAGFVQMGSADFWVGADRQLDHILVWQCSGANEA